MRRFVILGALTCITVAASAQRSTDSAGVRVIRYAVVAPAAIVTLTTPSLTLPQDGCELNRVSGIVLQSTGGIVVANSGNTELCLFDSGGQFVKKAGRKGAGPGEFTVITSLLPYRGDSIVVADGMQRRVSIFGPLGERGREFLTSKPDSGLGFYSFTQPLPDGTMLLGFSEFIMGPPRPDAAMFTQRLFHVSAAGTAPSRIGSFPHSEHFIQATPDASNGGTAYWDLAFGRIYSAAPLGDGFVGGDGADGMLRQYNATGKLRAIHNVGLERRPVTDETIASYRRAALLANTRPDRRAVEERRVADMPFPKQFPAYNRVITEDGSRIWVQPYPSGATSHWLRVDPASGSAQGFSFPLRFRLIAVRGGRACGVGRDDVDLETIYCFSLPK